MTVITLTTDFGSDDHEAGVLKGVIWNIAPSVKIADLSHDIAPQNVFEAALLLWRCAPYFPDGTVHLVVVDPGVGTTRRPIAARLGSQFFVGPDNGLISLLLANVEQQEIGSTIVHLDQPQYWLPEVSRVFHGRDIFAPCAAHLSTGTPLLKLGSQITDPIILNIPQPQKTEHGWQGQVIHIDHFGNLGTNLHASQHLIAKEVVVTIRGKHIDGMVSTFGDRPPGTLIALVDSSGRLAISVVNGSAAQLLGISLGDKIEVHLNE
jgi:S-adenosyl-L-methionine hydrolase (adenosine-forming)